MRRPKMMEPAERKRAVRASATSRPVSLLEVEQPAMQAGQVAIAPCGVAVDRYGGIEERGTHRRSFLAAANCAGRFRRYAAAGPVLWSGGMAMNWTSSDLSLVAAVPAGPRFGARLQEALRELVRRSVLGPGDALPSTRELADHLGLARGTVVTAYEQLTAEGYLLAQPGGRTRVSPAAGAAEQRMPQQAQSARPVSICGPACRI